MTKILVVDDEENIAQTLKYNLVREGYSVSTSGDGRQALEIFRRESPDLIVLDLMLPGMSGLDVCRHLRQVSTVPILMLTAREEQVDKVLGLELGADDYMTKPFSLRELITRIRSMLRRAEMLLEPAVSLNPEPAMTANSLKEAGLPQEILTVGKLHINVNRHSVTLDGQPVALKPKEFELLAFLARHRGQVMSREILLEQVWGYEFVGNSRTVDVHVRWLREKIEEHPSHPFYIHTVFGVGYKLEAGGTGPLRQPITK